MVRTGEAELALGRSLLVTGVEDGMEGIGLEAERSEKNVPNTPSKK